MRHLGLHSLVCFLITLTYTLSLNDKKKFIELHMPGIRTNQDDEYFCHAIKVPFTEGYITEFHPLVDNELAHHIILFTCEIPGSQYPTWHCGEEEDADPVCEGKKSIIFSWANGAPEFKMPANTSFPIDGKKYPYLVMQVHYKDAKSFANDPNRTDASGLKLAVQNTPTPKVAAVYLFITDGQLPAHSKVTFQAGCLYTGKATLHPFAFRVHAHSHGILNEGYVVHGDDKYLIGAKSPQVHQTFYPVENKSLVVNPKDILFAGCVMKNDEDRLIKMGTTRNDEMCNFYMMYWVPLASKEQLWDENNQNCFSDGTANLSELKRQVEELIDNTLDEFESIGDDVFLDDHPFR